MNITAAHQPAYLPWLGYFHKIALSDVFIVLDDVQFEKNSFTNRNKIKGPNGEFWLTVPVNLEGHTSKGINDIRIASSLWQKKHLKAIESSYQKAPYFEEYIPFFRDCYSKDWDKIIDLTDYMLSWFLDKLGINVMIKKMSELSVKSKKAELIYDITKELGSSVYVSGALGKDYIDEKEFKQKGLSVYFQEYKHPEYDQLYGDFVSNLSVLDLLFNCGNSSYEVLMKGNIAKEGILGICL